MDPYRSVAQSLRLARSARLDLDLLERAAIRRALDAGWSQGKVARELGVSRQAVSQRLASEHSRRRPGSSELELRQRAERERIRLDEAETRALLPPAMRAELDHYRPVDPPDAPDLPGLSEVIRSAIRSTVAADDGRYD